MDISSPAARAAADDRPPPALALGPGRAWLDTAILALLFGVLYALNLGAAVLTNPDEGRYAEVPREMLASGDYVLPRLDGVKYFEKPPLLYWIVAGVERVFGASEWALRAVPALFGLGGVLLTYAATRRRLGREAGLAAAVVLGSSLLFYALGRILLLDMAVSVLMTAVLFCFILGVHEPPASRRRRWLFYGLYASAALATLTKGLIGFLVPGAVMFLWLLVFNQWHRLRPLYLPSGVALFLALAAPWHLLAAQRDPEWARFYFIHEHWERFTTTEHGRYEPWWFFLPVVVLGYFPWTGFLWPALRDSVRGGWRARRENAEAWFFVTWAVFIFLFFSKSQSKLVPYILPVFPPLAVLVGRWFARVIAGTAPRRLGLGFGVFGALAGVLAVAMLVVVFRPGLIANAADAAAMRDNAIVGAIALLIGAIAAPWLYRHHGARPALLGVALASAGLIAALAHAQDELGRPSTKPLAEIVRAQAAPDDEIYHYFDFFQDFLFYSGRLVGTVEQTSELELAIDPAARASGRFIDEAEFLRRWNGSRRIWVVARKRDADPLFARPGFHYHLLGETRNHYLFSNQP